MDKLLLFPSAFKRNGLLMIAVGMVGLAVASQEGLINVYRLLLPGDTLSDGSYPYPSDFWQKNIILEYTSIALMVLGLLFFFLSKERDEFFYKIRLESIQFAILSQLLVAGLLYCFFYFSGKYQMENTFTAILSLSFAGFWITYIARYYYIVRFRAEKDSLN
ncbi:hypothetical protein [Dyadobacter aurulentus]|uniref:hypothetical protein n=1 Tax=Dyadobacter sp. UC 10 TaxID=2605428 RepID=UPI0011F0C9C7|nr:hypothetical protein [Dyadobacter sp. UC 10]KAA0993452.1 hypothetical protein FXO21_26385 [Dyadobacter sp. UC 10]